MKGMVFTAMGADPEVFLVDHRGRPVSAEGKIGGTKEKPMQMEGLEAGFMVQEDNVAAEYNIPPCMDRDSFSFSIQKGLTYIARQAARHRLRVAVKAALHFDPEQLATPHAQRLGCEPDLNLWDLRYNDPPRPPATLRTAAGHVHVSWNKPDKDQRILLTRTLDVFLGLPSILVTEKTDRRSLYGKAGSVRDKPYGLEYRTLDNFWISRKVWRQTVFDNTQRAINKVNNEGDFWAEELEGYEKAIRNAIDTHDVPACAELCKEFNVPLFMNPKAAIVE